MLLFGRIFKLADAALGRKLWSCDLRQKVKPDRDANPDEVGDEAPCNHAQCRKQQADPDRPSGPIPDPPALDTRR